MVDFEPLPAKTVARIIDYMGANPDAPDVYAAARAVRDLLGDRYDDWLCIADCVHDLRRTALRKSGRARVSDLPADLPDSACYLGYLVLSDLDREYHLSDSVAALSDGGYCGFLAALAMARLRVPPDAEFFAGCVLGGEPPPADDPEAERRVAAYYRLLTHPDATRGA